MEYFSDLRVPLGIIKHATKNFDAENFIAKGGFGKVYRGDFSNSKGRFVGAVKRLHRSENQLHASFGTEILLLSNYKHRNLISLIGFCDESEELIILYEYASNKSLDYHISSPTLTWMQRLKICLGAARGLQYLHDPNGTQQRVIHRDIKSANILLDENWNAKIADFGLSRYGPANQENTFIFSEAKGTIGYCDPVYAERALLTKESDVYSFGVVMCEVMCSRHCIDARYTDERRSLAVLVKERYGNQKLISIIEDNLLQQMDEKSLFTFAAVAYQCVGRDRRLRPPMDFVVRELETALKYQESFEAKELERRNNVSGKVVGITCKSQDEEREKKVLQHVADYEVHFQEGKIRNKVAEDSQDKSQQEQDQQSPSKWVLNLKDTDNPLLSYEKMCPPRGSNSVILYMTTFKGIPKTFEDCSNILSLLKSFKIAYEERDLSINWEFKEELRHMLRENIVLPKLFIKGRYIGGANDVLQLHKQGKFRYLLAGIPQNISK